MTHFLHFFIPLGLICKEFLCYYLEIRNIFIYFAEYNSSKSLTYGTEHYSYEQKRGKNDDKTG